MSPEVEEKLKPHQVAPARHLLHCLGFGNAVDLSDGGTGKTFVACAIAKTLARPTLVVAPKIVLTAWKRAAEHFGDTISVINYEMLRTGNTPYGCWSKPKPADYTGIYFQCQNCQQKIPDALNIPPCPVHHAGIHCVATRRKPWNYGQFNFDRRIGLIIFDEVHRASALDSQNAALLLAARRQEIRTMGLSATPACSPLQMRGLGYMLDLFPLPDFYSWAIRRGCGKLPGVPGFRWLLGEDKQRAVMSEIRASIIPSRGVSVSTRDIPGFPECQIQSDLFDLDNYEKIDELYQQMAVPLAALERKQENDVDVASRLTVQLRLRQKLELLKVPIALDLAADYLAKGYSVAYFVNFSATLAEIRKRAGVECFIDGTQSVDDRETSVEKFQNNERLQIAANAEAGGIGIGLHDIHGGHPRVGIVFPGFKAVTIRQVFLRLPRVGSKSPSIYRVLFVANTMEEPMHRTLRLKLNNIDTLRDGDLQPDNLRIL